MYWVFVFWSGNTGDSRGVFSARFFRKCFLDVIHGIPFGINWFFDGWTVFPSGAYRRAGILEIPVRLFLIKRDRDEYHFISDT